MKRKLQVKNLVLFSLITLFLVGIISTYAVAQVKMTLWEWSRTEHPEEMQAIYAEFERKYNVKLEISSPNIYELVKKLLIAGEAAEVPDLMQLWASAQLPQLAALGALECLDPYMDEEFRARYDPRFLNLYGGKMYALPLGGSVVGLLYNKEMFQKAGIARPPKTWEQLVLIGQKLTHPEKGEYGLALNGADEESLVVAAPFIVANSSHVGKFNGKIWINSPESVEAAQFIIDLNNKYKVIPGYPETTFKIAREMFRKQKAAMLVDAAWVVPHFIDAPFEWAITTLPERKSFGSVADFGDPMYAMSSRTLHKDLAWEFLKYMASEKTVTEMLGFEFKLPALKVLWDRREFIENPYLQYEIEYIKLGTVVPMYTELPYQRTKSIDIFKTEMHAATLGMKTAKQAMDTVAEKWSKLFEEWEEKYPE